MEEAFLEQEAEAQLQDQDKLQLLHSLNQAVKPRLLDLNQNLSSQQMLDSAIRYPKPDGFQPDVLVIKSQFSGVIASSMHAPKECSLLISKPPAVSLPT